MPRKLRIQYPGAMRHAMSRANRRGEITRPIEAVARRMHLGTPKGANLRLHAAMRTNAPADPAQGRLGIWKKTHHGMG